MLNFNHLQRTWAYRPRFPAPVRIFNTWNSFSPYELGRCRPLLPTVCENDPGLLTHSKLQLIFAEYTSTHQTKTLRNIVVRMGCKQMLKVLRICCFLTTRYGSNWNSVNFTENWTQGRFLSFWWRRHGQTNWESYGPIVVKNVNTWEENSTHIIWSKTSVKNIFEKCLSFEVEWLRNAFLHDVKWDEYKWN